AGVEICARLCLEITETAAVTHMADASDFVDEVRRLGVRVALDDFGAGASSFGYLKNLRVDLLKIDGQFVRDVLDDPLDEV
ncbi:EAL domain-containing protein, partial [Acinetobacter baumannii]